MDGTPYYPGQRLGLPESGPGSIAGWGLRFVALLIDWFACLGVATVVSGGRNLEIGVDFYTPAIFLFQLTVLTGIAGGSFGQILLRLAVVRLDRRPVNLFQALVRSVLILLVIPPLVFNRDGRGLHDLVFDTAVVHR